MIIFQQNLILFFKKECDNRKKGSEAFHNELLEHPWIQRKETTNPVYRPGELQSKHLLETQIRNSDSGKSVDQEMEEHLVV